MNPEAIEKFLEENDWRYFEDFVMEIFEKHDYNTIKHFRFKGTSRREIDVLAWNEHRIFIIECKRWKKHRPKTFHLKEAAKKVIDYLNDFKTVYSKSIATKFGDTNNKEIIPIIVTLYEEPIKIFENVLIVPLWKLNSLLLNLDEILDNLFYNK